MSHPTVILSQVDTMCVFDEAIELNGNPIGGVFEGDGVVGDVFTPAASGTGPQTIFYSYIDSNGCTNVSSTVIQVESCTSVNDVLESAIISIYPNPAIDFVRIECPAGSTLRCEMFSANGMSVLDQQLSGNREFDVSGFASGSYLIRLTSEDAVYTSKLNIFH